MAIRTKANDSEQIWLVVNPNSGGGNSVKKKKFIIEKATEMGWRGKYCEATKNKTVRVWIEEAIKAGVKDIIIGGGDGTIRDALKTVTEANLTLGLLPLGTGNVLARNLEIPLDIEEAIRVALHGKIKDVDLGEVNGSYFGVITGMGIDVDAMSNTDKSSKSRWGVLAYLWSGLQSLSKSRSKYRIVINDMSEYIVRAKSISVANMAKTVGGIEIAPGAGPQSNDLKVVIISPGNIRSGVDLLINALRGQVKKSPYYKIIKAQKVKIYPLKGAKNYEVDGDDLPPTAKLEISFHPKALKVRVPAVDMGSRMVDKKKNILVFDFDGTLADTLQASIEAFNGLAGKYGYPQVTKERTEELRGQSAKEVVESLGIGKTKLLHMVAEGRDAFLTEQKHQEIFPGMKDVLLKLKNQYGLGIVTSNTTEVVNAFLKTNDLQIFDFIYTDKSIFGKGKILKQLIQKYGFEKTQLTYVGDEVRDIDAARESGIKIAAVSWGFNTKEILLKNQPDWLVDKPKDLLNLSF